MSHLENVGVNSTVPTPAPFNDGQCSGIQKVLVTSVIDFARLQQSLVSAANSKLNLCTVNTLYPPTVVNVSPAASKGITEPSSGCSYDPNALIVAEGWC